jgi:integrase
VFGRLLLASPVVVWSYDHDLVFAGRSGQPLSLTSLRNNHFKPALERAKLPKSIRIYDLRHTAATHAVMAAVETGAGVTYVGRWIGHASLKMTLDTYTHATEEGTRAVSEAVAGARLGSFTTLSHPPTRNRDS